MLFYHASHIFIKYLNQGKQTNVKKNTYIECNI